MGNTIAPGSSKKAKIMKIDGEIFKLKAPTTAMDVLKGYSQDHVLLESRSVKKLGIRAPQLAPWEELKPGKMYFLVEMPRFPEPERQAALTGQAEGRLEGLKQRDRPDSGSGSMRIKMRVSRARIEELMKETKDDAEMAEKILDLCLEASRD